MGLLDIAGSFASSFKLNDVVGDLFGSQLDSMLGSKFGGIATDVLSGAITNAAVAGIAGGDIGKAALYGGVGGGFTDGGFLGKFGNEVGGAISGYGLSDALGGEGWQGALAGAGGAFLADSIASPTPGLGTKQNVAQNGPQTSTPTTPAATIQDKLMRLGLINKDGDGTLLGKGLVSGVAGAAQMKMTKDILEERAKIDNERDSKQKQNDLDAEQARIAAFSKPGLRVVRNG